MTDDDPVLTLHEAATVLRRDYRTVLRYVRDPHSGLRGVKPAGRWYVRTSALRAFLADRDPADAA